jgi:hypothetical protein
MDFSEVRDHLEQEYRFPVGQETLVSRIGSVELAATTTDPETTATVLNRTDRTTYRSARDVYETLVGTVGDAYVGRKYYDDRSGVRAVTHDRPVVSL